MSQHSLSGNATTFVPPSQPTGLPIATSSRLPGRRRTASGPEGRERAAADDIYTFQTLFAAPANPPSLAPTKPDTTALRQQAGATTQNPSVGVTTIAQATRATQNPAQYDYERTAQSDRSVFGAPTSAPVPPATPSHYPEAIIQPAEPWMHQQPQSGIHGPHYSGETAFSYRPPESCWRGPEHGFVQHPTTVYNHSSVPRFLSQQQALWFDPSASEAPPGASSINQYASTPASRKKPEIDNHQRASDALNTFTHVFGSSTEDFIAWRKLCYVCGVDPWCLGFIPGGRMDGRAPASFRECRDYLKTVYINIFDVVEAAENSGVVHPNLRFSHGQDLKDYSFATKKICPRGVDEGNELWRFMLKRLDPEIMYEKKGWRTKEMQGRPGRKG